jgi:molybdopterin-guanine dinucleotide biosynthesis protein B
LARKLAIVGTSGSGKTTLLERLIPALERRGVSVAAIKHSHHDAFDRQGSDTARLRAAGARAVLIEGPGQFALFGPRRGSAVRLLPRVDLVLLEGFKSAAVQKVEVHRGAGPLLCAKDRRIIALVSRRAAPRGIPRFRAGDFEGLAAFLVRRLGLPVKRPHPVANRRASKRDR